MGLFNLENARERLRSGFWDNIPKVITIRILEKCEFDECPNYALRNSSFCKTHKKEFDNIEKGKNPS